MLGNNSVYESTVSQAIPTAHFLVLRAFFDFPGWPYKGSAVQNALLSENKN